MGSSPLSTIRAAGLAALCLPLLLAGLPGCGGGNDELAATEARAMVVKLARAVVENDKEQILSYVLRDAGLGSNAVAAQDLDTKDGYEKHREGQRRTLRKMIWKDGAITTPADIDRFDQALKVIAQGKQARATFDIAENKEEKLSAETVTLRLVKTDDGWRVQDWDRKIKTR